MSQIRCLTVRGEIGIISTDSNITDNIIRKVINYSRKSVGPRIKYWGTPALNGYSCYDFPSSTTWSHLLLREGEIRPNIWPGIPEDLILWRRPAWQTMLKVLDISSATAHVAPDLLLKALAILLDATVRKSAVDWEDLKPYWKSWKRPHFWFHSDHWWDLPTILKTRLFQTHIEKFS